jgi:hypothetical protein
MREAFLGNEEYEDMVDDLLHCPFFYRMCSVFGIAHGRGKQEQARTGRVHPSGPAC